jgi:hypothetical protein
VIIILANKTETGETKLQENVRTPRKNATPEFYSSKSTAKFIIEFAWVCVPVK